MFPRRCSRTRRCIVGDGVDRGKDRSGGPGIQLLREGWGFGRISPTVVEIIPTRVVLRIALFQSVAERRRFLAFEPRKLSLEQ